MEEKKNGISRRGFASMTPERRSEIARMGGKSAHALGKAHTFTTAEAQAAGRKGGLSVSRNKEHMAQIGSLGGTARAKQTSPDVQPETPAVEAAEGTEVAQ